MAEEITPELLDPEIARQLRTLPKGLAEEVARRLVSAELLIADDPQTAHLHTMEATRIASRVAAVREATGVTAYATGHWAQALAELRAARRMSGSDDFLPMMADCERGLGRPERALALAGSPEAARLDPAGRVEMRIVASGARRDLGQLDAALVTLRCPELKDARAPWAARLRYAYADALAATGDDNQAMDWFAKAAAVDAEGETEAAERLADLQGISFEDYEGYDETDIDRDNSGDDVSADESDATVDHIVEVSEATVAPIIELPVADVVSAEPDMLALIFEAEPLVPEPGKLADNEKPTWPFGNPANG